MAQRKSLILLALFLATVLGPIARLSAQTTGIDRLTLPDGGLAPVDLRADYVVTWIEGDTRIVGLSGNSLIQQGTTMVKAHEAFIWEKLTAPKNSPHPLTIYATGNVTVSIDEATTKHQRIVAQWSTRGASTMPAGKVDPVSAANTPIYKEALAARDGTVAPTNLKIAALGDNPAEPSSSNNVILPVQLLQPALDPPPGSTVPPGPPPPASTLPAPLGATTREPPLFQTPMLTLPTVSTRILRIAPRTNVPNNAKYLNMGNGVQVGMITGGIKILAIFPERKNMTLDVEADQLVIWQTGGGSKTLMDSVNDKEGVDAGNDKHIEIYLSGNVVMRYGNNSDVRGPDGAPIDTKILRAEQVYYDVTKNTAIALRADLEMLKLAGSSAPPGAIQPAHLTSAEIMQVSPQEWQTKDSTLAGSKLPAEPGIKMTIAETTLYEQKQQPRTTIFGLPFYDRLTGDPILETARTYEATSATIRVEDIPIMYFPYLKGDANDPFGPLSMFSFQQSTMFGYQFYTTWDVLELIGLTRLPGEHWGLMLDYMTARGPGMGTNYTRSGQTMFGEDAPYNVLFKVYGIYDHGTDSNIAGPRNVEFQPTAWRDRVLFQYQQQYNNWYLQSQLSWLSDHNFLEMYYNYEWNQGPNQETFAHLKYQQGIGAATVLFEQNFDRYWVTETSWLPKLDGYWIGQDLLWDTLTYNTWGSAAYANMQVYNLPQTQLPAGVNASQFVNEYAEGTGRVDWYQQIKAPVSLGFLKLVPYGNVDLTWYSQDVNGNERGRVYAGGGSYATTSLSRIYDDVYNEFFNIKGLAHKNAFTVNYYNAWTDTPYYLLPQLDRLDDDATAQSVRDVKPWYTTYFPGPVGTMLMNSPLYDPRLYAIRRLEDTKVDTLSDIQVVQLDWRQRLQTQRGYDGQEHTVDWITLDLSASIFPEYNRDNFGHPIGFVEYYGTWAIGDRNGVTSAGWFDPFAFGTHYWNISSYFTRPDGTNFTISYRQLDPIGSKVVQGSIAYNFSPKYRITYTTSYDFGLGLGLTQNLAVVRTGTDLTFSFGFSYNALANNFGVNFVCVPNFLATGSLSNTPVGLNNSNPNASAQYR